MPYDINAQPKWFPTSAKNKDLRQRAHRRLKDKQALEDQARLQSLHVDLKEKLPAWIEEQLNLLRLTDSNRRELKVRNQGLLTGLFSMLETIYLRDEVAVGAKGANHKVVIIKKDKHTHSFNWRTSPENIRLATRYGIIPVQSLTGKVIKALGNYHKVELSRIYDDAIISDKYLEKNLLLTFSQQRVEWLQELELLTNSYDERLGSVENQNRILLALNNYRDTLHAYNPKRMQLLDHYYPGMSQIIKSFIEEDQHAVEALIKKFDHPDYPVIDNQELEAFYAPTGPHSVMTFIKERMFHNVRNGQFINQKLTGSPLARSLMRGELHNTYWDVFDIITDHRADLHNLHQDKHQGKFPDAGKLLSVDFSHLNEEERKIACMVISQVEGDDEVIITKEECYLQSKNKPPYPLTKTNMTKWTYARVSAEYGWLAGLFISLARLAVWVLKIVIAVAFALPNILYGCFLGILQTDSPDFGKWFNAVNVYLGRPWEFITGVVSTTFLGSLYQFCTKAFKVVGTALSDDKLPDSKYAEIVEKMPIRTHSASLNMGVILGSLLRELVYEFGKGVIYTGKRVLRGIFEDIPDDSYLAKGLRSETEILKQMDAELAELKKKNHQAETLLNTLHQQNYGKPMFDGKPVTKAELDCVPAVAPYALTPCDGNDVINAVLTRALKSVCLTHPRAIGERHPITFLIFIGVYIIDSYAILSTHAANPTTVWENYQAAVQNFADSLSAQGSFQFISTSFTHAQLAAGLAEFAVDGKKSWIVKAFRTLGTDPDQLFIGAGAIILFGQVLMHVNDIPVLRSMPIVNYLLRWTGEKIQEEMGIGMWKWMTFFGATTKLLLIIYELLEHEKGHLPNASKEEIKKRLYAVIEPCYRELKQLGKDDLLSDEAINELNVCVQGLMSEDMLRRVEQFRTQALAGGGKERNDVSMQAVIEKMLSVRQQLNSPQKKRADFLARFSVDAAQLPLLHHRTKREIIELARRKFANEPELIAAIRQSLYPEKEASIAVETLVNIVGKFTSGLVRLCASVFNGYKPIRKEFVETCKEIAIRRIIHPISVLFHLIGIGVTFLIRWAADLIFNAIIDRVTGYGGETTYRAMAKFDCAYENLRQYVSQPVDAARKSVTHASTHIIKDKFAEVTQRAKEAVMRRQQPSMKVKPQVLQSQTVRHAIEFHHQPMQKQAIEDDGVGLGRATMQLLREQPVKLRSYRYP